MVRGRPVPLMISSSHPVLTCAAAKAWESRLLPDEAAEWTAMQAAGRQLGGAMLDDFLEIGGLPVAARLLVLAGKGHNGGDAVLAAQSILERHPLVTADILLAFGERALRPLAARALAQVRGAAGPRLRSLSLVELQSESASYDLCIDGIFGFQFRPPMDEVTARLIAWVNPPARLRLRAAVDLPSGLGERNAGTAFRADFTYATGVVKAPVLDPANAGFVGRLRYLDLGFFARGQPEPNALGRVLTAAVLEPIASLRAAQSDKRTYGHLLVVGGSHSYPGAVVLAVRAALRSGAGLVTAFVPEAFVPEFASRHPEAMWVGCPVNAAGGLAQGTAALVQARLSRANAMLVGPGLGADPETIALAEQLATETPVPLVIDADALRPAVLAAVRDRPFIGTPHAGEFQRIEPALFSDGEFMAPLGVLVRKGPITRIISRAGLRPAQGGQSETGPTQYYSLFGGPVLARGGSGDVLAGLTGGLLAQQPQELLRAACQGVVWHGRAADLLARAHGQVAVETSQLLEQLGPALIFTPCPTP